MPLTCRNTRAPQSSELDLFSTGLRAGLAELRLGWDRLLLHQHTSNTLRSSWEQLQPPQHFTPFSPFYVNLQEALERFNGCSAPQFWIERVKKQPWPRQSPSGYPGLSRGLSSAARLGKVLHKLGVQNGVHQTSTTYMFSHRVPKSLITSWPIRYT